MVIHIFYGTVWNQEEVSEKLAEVLEDSNSQVLLDCSPLGIYVARYLKNHHYRSGILYHTGDSPRVNICNFPTRGGFGSEEEYRSQMKIDKESTD